MLTIETLILMLIICCPRHELHEPVLRAEVSGYFAAAGNEYNIPWNLMIYYGEREASLDHTRVGTRGEVGYCQAHGKARKTCEAAGYDPTTRRGGTYCMALLMDMGIRRCGSVVRGLGWYMSGSCGKANEKARKRLRACERITGSSCIPGPRKRGRGHGNER